MMLGKTIRLTANDDRWVELTVSRKLATARVGEGEPFPFSFEHLSFVAHGMTYQAWGSGSHFIFRKTDGGFAAEFQGSKDRSPAICRLSEAELHSVLEELEPRTATESRVQML